MGASAAERSLRSDPWRDETEAESDCKLSGREILFCKAFARSCAALRML